MSNNANNSTAQEERTHISSVRNAIKNEIKSKENSLKSSWDSELTIKDQYSIEDYETVAASRRSIVRKKKNLELLKKRVSSPYFGRMEINLVYKDPSCPPFNPEQNIYIGYDDIKIRNKDIVKSWQSEWGEKFLNAQSTAYSQLKPFGRINSYRIEYSITKKIDVEIHRGKYVSHKVRFCEKNREVKQEEIHDSFLKDILQRRLEQNQPTNIIRSIQSQQNKIIWLPDNYNFIVQGCAGSGKTMILLHRLSVMEYRSKAKNQTMLSKTVVISPTEELIQSLQNLKTELGLNQLEIYTLPRYFSLLTDQLLKRPSSQYSICSENELPQPLLKYIYSSKILNDINKEIESTTKDYRNLYQTILKELSNILEYSYPAPGNTLNNLYSQCQNIVLDLQRERKNAEDKRNDLKRNIHLLKLNIQKEEENFVTLTSPLLIQNALQTYLEQVLKMMKYLKSYCLDNKIYLTVAGKEFEYRKDSLNKAIMQLLQFKSDPERSFTSLKNQYASVTDKFNKTTSQLLRLKMVLHLLSMGISDEFPFEELMNHKPIHAVPYNIYSELLRTSKYPLATMIVDLLNIHEETENLIAQSDELQKKYELMNKPYGDSDPPVRKLVKRLKKNKQQYLINQKEEKSLKVKIIQFCTPNKRNRLKHDYLKTSEKLDSLKSEYTSLKLLNMKPKDTWKIDDFSRLNDNYKKLNEIIRSNHLTSTRLKSYLSDFGDPVIDMIFANIYSISDKYETEKRRIERLKINLTELIQKQSQMEEEYNYLFTREAEGLVDFVEEAVNNLSFEVLSESVIQTVINGTFKELPGPETEGLNYPFKYYLKCFIAQKYTGRNTINDTAVLCIDEAQDISLGEYSLLKSNHSRSLVWNLYGDIHQNINDFKGISSWDELKLFNKSYYKFFNLNQNYRNSFEISEFTNSSLNTDMVSLGLTGPPVITLNWQDFRNDVIHELSSQKNSMLVFKNTPENKSTLKGVDKALIREVHQVKGMEYRKVFVLKNGMTPRELYLAYTRAMESLIILT